MHWPTWSATALTLLTTLGAASAVAERTRSSETGARPSSQSAELLELGGEWLYVEDRTKDRAVEDQGPPMSPRLWFRVDEDALVWVRSQGREDRMPLNRTITEDPQDDKVTRYTGAWKDGRFEYESETVRVSDSSRITLLRKVFERTSEGMLVHVALNPPGGYESVALYRHPEDIELPKPAKAKIDDLAWLAGAWLGTPGKSSTEERWSPPGGGAMLGVSRTVKDAKMVAFEYLRVVERAGGLVYVAQPSGNPPTEFVLTEMEGTRAVFENPRHDSPQRITYELSTEGGLTASIGFIHGGRPQRFEFQREEG